ncbi:MAG: hypothetical protein KatS3mg053_1659 [Candidatus Roseilinea sp.]|nr:MAG: hypothetical protein KatS3mg053_1659 [Candidatus Roseilinea sp.]
MRSSDEVNQRLVYRITRWPDCNTGQQSCCPTFDGRRDEDLGARPDGVHELVEQIARVVWAGGGFGVILHAKGVERWHA